MILAATFGNDLPWPVGYFEQSSGAYLSAAGLAALVAVPALARARFGPARQAARRAATAMLNLQLTVVLCALFLLAAGPMILGLLGNEGSSSFDVFAGLARLLLVADAIVCLVAAARAAAGRPFRIPGVRFAGRDGTERDERWITCLAFAFGALPGIAAPLFCLRAVRTARAKRLIGTATVFNALITAVLWSLDHREYGRYYLSWLLPGGQLGHLRHYDSAIRLVWLLGAVAAVTVAVTLWRRPFAPARGMAGAQERT